MSRRGVLTAFVLGLAGLGGSAIVDAPLLVWNASASAPEGLWLRVPGRAGVGDWALVRPAPEDARLLAGRGLLPEGALLVKTVAAGEGQVVCRAGRQVLVDGRVAAWARAADRRGRPLPRWRGCRRLGAGEVFLLNRHPDSFDGRYFGVSPARDVVGRAARLWAP